MTLIGLLSDIHANALALEVVYNYLRREKGVKQYWVLGDSFGYGPYVENTWRLLRAIRPKYHLAGNHDHYIVPGNLDALTDNHDYFSEAWQGDGLLPGPSISEGEHSGGPHLDAWEVCMNHRRYIAENNFEIFDSLANLPERERPFDNVFISHAVYTSDGYGNKSTWLEKSVSNPSIFKPYFQAPAPWHEMDCDLPILHVGGHTHLPSLWSIRFDKPHQWEIADSDSYTEPIPEKVYRLEAGKFYYINPGSVGMPRGQRPGPSAAVLDTEQWTITFYHFDKMGYNSEIVREEMAALKYPSLLWSERQLKKCVPD